ncbi:MAG: hypothetical protein HYU99_04155 [Deltaproteobacteria bacterium]|nr:hypothetical protein [Deltaproteobacteria bacterium]
MIFMGAPLQFFSPFFLKVFLAFAEQILPVRDKADLPANTMETARRAELLILEQEKAKQLLLKLFFVFLQYFAVFYFRKSFTALAREQKIDYLKKMEHFRISKVRLGFWGIKVFVYWGYYTQPESWTAIRYEGPLVTGSRV